MSFISINQDELLGKIQEMNKSFAEIEDYIKSNGVLANIMGFMISKKMLGIPDTDNEINSGLNNIFEITQQSLDDFFKSVPGCEKLFKAVKENSLQPNAESDIDLVCNCLDLPFYIYSKEKSDLDYKFDDANYMSKMVNYYNDASDKVKDGTYDALKWTIDHCTEAIRDKIELKQPQSVAGTAYTKKPKPLDEGAMYNDVKKPLYKDEMYNDVKKPLYKDEKTINVLKAGGNLFKNSTKVKSVDDLNNYFRKKYGFADKTIAFSSVENSAPMDYAEMPKAFESVLYNTPPMAAPQATVPVTINPGITSRDQDRIDWLLDFEGLVYDFDRGIILIDRSGKKVKEVVDPTNTRDHHVDAIERLARREFGIEFDKKDDALERCSVAANQHNLVAIMGEGAKCYIFLPEELTESQIDEIINEINPRKDFVFALLRNVYSYTDLLTQEEVLEFFQKLKDQLKEEDNKIDNADYVRGVLNYISTHGMTVNQYYTILGDRISRDDTIDGFPENNNPLITLEEFNNLRGANDISAAVAFANRITERFNALAASLPQLNDDNQNVNSEGIDNRREYIKELNNHLSKNHISLEDYYRSLANKKINGDESIEPFEAINPFLNDSDYDKLKGSKDDRMPDYFANTMSQVIRLNEDAYRKNYIDALNNHLNNNHMNLEDYYRSLANKKINDDESIEPFEAINPFLNDSDYDKLKGSKDDRMPDYFANAMSEVIRLNENQASNNNKYPEFSTGMSGMEPEFNPNLGGVKKPKTPTGMSGMEPGHNPNLGGIKKPKTPTGMSGMEPEFDPNLGGNKHPKTPTGMSGMEPEFNPNLGGNKHPKTPTGMSGMEPEFNPNLGGVKNPKTPTGMSGMEPGHNPNLGGIKKPKTPTGMSGMEPEFDPNLGGNKHPKTPTGMSGMEPEFNPNLGGVKKPKTPTGMSGMEPGHNPNLGGIKNPKTPNGMNVNKFNFEPNSFKIADDDTITLDRMPYLDSKTNYMSGIRIRSINTELINKLNGLAVVREPRTGKINVYGYENDNLLSGKKTIDDKENIIESGYYVNLSEYVGILAGNIMKEYGNDAQVAFTNAEGDQLDFFQVINEIMTTCRNEGALRYGREYKDPEFSNYEDLSNLFDGRKGIFKGIELTKGLYVRRDILIDELNKYKVAIAENRDSVSHVR